MNLFQYLRLIIKLKENRMEIEERKKKEFHTGQRFFFLNIFHNNQSIKKEGERRKKALFT